MRAKVIVLAGPSGAGKSRLCTRLGLPVLSLDDYYKDGSDPTLPWVDLGGGHRIVDWDDPCSWLAVEAIEAVERLCVDGDIEAPVYDIAQDARVGYRKLRLGAAGYFVAEGIFAQEIVGDCEERGLLARAVCVRNPRPITFWRRLTRDLREHRKPPLVLLRRGVRLTRREPEVVAHAVALGCTPMTSEEAYRELSRLVGA